MWTYKVRKEYTGEELMGVAFGAGAVRYTGKWVTWVVCRVISLCDLIVLPGTALRTLQGSKFCSIEWFVDGVEL